jgi:hypothetical protein
MEFHWVGASLLESSASLVESVHCGAKQHAARQRTPPREEELCVEGRRQEKHGRGQGVYLGQVDVIVQVIVRELADVLFVVLLRKAPPCLVSGHRRSSPALQPSPSAPENVLRHADG